MGKKFLPFCLIVENVMALTLLPRERQNLFFHGWKLAQSLESLVKIKENETLVLTKQGCVGIKRETFKASNNMHLHS
jgi:hypothetical protein